MGETPLPAQCLHFWLDELLSKVLQAMFEHLTFGTRDIKKPVLTQKAPGRLMILTKSVFLPPLTHFLPAHFNL